MLLIAVEDFRLMNFPCAHHKKKEISHSLLPYFVINSTPLDLVPHFKYLGVYNSSNLSWSPHVDFISTKNRKLLGVLYGRFYAVSEPDSLLEIYKTQIRPHLEYAAQVWDPYLSKDIHQLESIQKFALKLCTKQWGSNYEDIAGLPTQIISRDVMPPQHPPEKTRLSSQCIYSKTTSWRTRASSFFT